MANSIYENVTQQVVEMLEEGTRPWETSSLGVLPLRACGIPYRGINTLILWSMASVKGYSSPVWLTFKQATALGGHVRKGEKSSQVVYASAIHKTVETEDGDIQERDIPFLKAYRVFNAEQCDNLPEMYYAKPTSKPIAERIDRAEQFIQATGATIRYGGNVACYIPKLDEIRLPEFSAFPIAERFYGCLSHELSHWTGAEPRLNRQLANAFGSEAYAFEELIAELSSAFVCATLEITSEPPAENAAYLASWLKVLKADSKAIFKVASYAQKASDYLFSLQGAPMQSEESALAA